MAELVQITVMMAPLLFVLVMANMAEKRRIEGRAQKSRKLARIAFAPLVIFYVAAFLAGFDIQQGAPVLGRVAEAMHQAGIREQAAFEFGAIDSPGLIGMGLWLPSLFGLLLLTEPARQGAARITNLDAENPLHAGALSLSMLIFINLLATVGVGLGNATDLLQAQEALEPTSTGGTIAMIWLQQIAFALTALVGVGWLTRRTLGEALERLGLVVPTRRQVLLGVGWAFLLIPMIGLIGAVSTFFGVGANPDVERLTEQMLGPLFQSPLGILTLGASAALGEETVFRGALQPPFGLVVTALLFALLHSNYGISASTAIVFLLGLVLGRLRLRHNTTTAMVTHATYNMILGLLTYISLSLMEL
ncbi:MAG: CPBP family intramembrane metalloprotease [Caldilineaceae bacterium]|nr:CPBP family intramembrane metalloprotease [Caldilineaceae bacterium]